MDTPVSCPVCTLYLREGVSLQTHLNTHPKDQVIEALLKYCGSVRDASVSGDVESAVDANFENQENDQTVAECAVPAISSQQQYPCSSSHFTAAVTYQQFMSSNASVGGSVLPQCFSVPAIITTPAGEPGQATLMPLLYNPYVIQQQQQQLQFYNAFRSIPPQPLPRQIVSPPLFPISPQFNVATTGNPIYQPSMSSSSTLQNGENIQSDATIFVPSVTVEEGTDLKSTDDQEGAPSENPKYRENDDSKEPSEQADVQSIEDNEIDVKSVETESKNDICNSPEIVIDDDPDSNHIDCTKDISSTGNIYENEENIDSYNKATEDDENCSIENDAGSNVEDPPSNRVSPSLRVRSDLNRINQNSSDSFLVEDGNSNSPELCTDDNARDENEDPSVSGHKTGPDSGWGFHPQREKISSDVIFIGGREKDCSEYITSDLYPTAIESKSSEAPPTVSVREQESNTSPRHFKVVDIEGMQVLVASHILTENENPNEPRDTEHPIRTPSQHSSYEPIPRDNEDVNATTNPDIQTDEVMPAMGELSGQESIGENDTNSWSQEKDDIATSYDLLAREKWEVSDGSDEENDGDGDVAPESMVCEEQPLSTHHLSPLPEPGLSPSEQLTSSSNCVVPPHHHLVLIHSQSQSPSLPPPSLPSPNQVLLLPTGSTVGEDIREEKSKKKEKPRCFYKCWTCNQVFTCPKERRVHQSEKHGVARLDPKLGGLKSTSWPLVKSEGNMQEDGALKHTQEEGEKIRIKSESDLLPSIPEEINDNKGDPVIKPRSFREDCMNDIRSVEDASKSEEDAFKFICSRCEGVFASAKSLHCHVRTVHGQSQFTCRTCGEKFPTESTYLAHLKVHPLECSRCGKYFYRHQNLNLHIRRHLGIKPFKCTICDKAFVTKQKLTEHTNTHTGDTPIKCNLCTETFRRYSNLIQHKNRHHLKLKKKVKDFICHCGEVFHSQKKLHWHKEIHDEKPKTCNYCSERFVHASSLTRHIRKAHDQRYFPCQGRESENVECPICGCIFLKSSLPVHMRLHSGERPYNCHICGKNFSTKWNLQLHRWTHASRSLKPYKCSLCKSAFIRHSEYTSHMHSHRNVRPYTCNYCGSQFIRKYNCIRHAREHESEKPFTCNICQKSFHRRYYLKEHMRIHSGLRPFTCHICGKTSSTKSNHNKHVKIHHAREAVNTEG